MRFICTMRKFWIVYSIGILLSSCFQKHPKVIAAQNQSVRASTTTDSASYYFLSPWRDSLYKSMNVVLGYADTAFNPGLPGGNLNNLVADLVLKYANDILQYRPAQTIHACVLNRGGLRASLPHDSIRVGNIYEIMPFENELVILKISGAAMDSLLKQISVKKGAAVSGISMEIGHGDFQHAIIADNMYDSRREYWIATNDYMAQGGDGFNMFSSPIQKIELHVKIRDILISEIQQECNKNGLLIHRNDSRIREF